MATAVRSGGQGMMYSVAIFATTTVAGIVGCVWLFLDLDRLKVEQASLAREYEEIATPGERGSEAVVALRSQGGGRSVVGALLAERQANGQLLVGDPLATTDSIRNGLGLGEQDVASAVLGGLRRDLTAAQAKIRQMDSDAQSAQAAAQALREQVDQATAEKERAIEQVRAALAPFRDAAARQAAELAALKEEFAAHQQSLVDDARSRESELQARIDQLNEESSLLQVKVGDLQSVVEKFRLRAADAAEFVDGSIVSVNEDGNQVYISLGTNDRLQQGTTFEVYNNASEIGVDPATGQQRPGKAKIEVIKVGNGASLAKVVAARVRQRPVARGDAIANAVFSADHEYKFLVHGAFDADHDGVPTSGEASWIRQRITDWGGKLAEDAGDGAPSLTGDVDFLVIGIRPPPAPPLPLDASDAQFDAYLRQREEIAAYDELVRQARSAQIPILNWNRFLTLTGSGAR